jgi:copper chaperone CopZ
MTVAELAIGGMTCASCAARIERKLNLLDGVSAAVNFATETARVTFPTTVRTEDLVSAVERAGYTALLAPGGQPPGDPPAWGATRPPKPPWGGCRCRWPWPSRWCCWGWSRRGSSRAGRGPAWR